MKKFEDMEWDSKGITPEYQVAVRVKLVEPMLGTVPTDREVYSDHIIGRLRKEIAKKSIDPDLKVKYQEALAVAEREETETIEETEEKGFTSFHKDEKTGELFLYDYMIRGFLKAAAGALKERFKTKKDNGGEEAFGNYKGRIDSFVFVEPRRIMLGKTEADGVLERPLRAETAQGPRVCLAKSDLISAGTEFQFAVKTLSKAKVSEAQLRELFRYGMHKGLGQFRNGSYGRFVFKMLAD